METSQQEAKLSVKLIKQCCCRDDSSFSVCLADVGVVEPDNASLNGHSHDTSK